jgi:transketolase
LPACGLVEAVYERNDTRTRLDRPVARPDVKELEAIVQELRATIEDQFVESGQYDEIMASCGLTAEHIVAAAKTAVVRKRS